jgi:outer membrane cobalamin receptor
VLFLTAACAAEVRVRVVDPQGAVIAGARVQLESERDVVLAVATTSGDGVADFPQVTTRAAHVRVLAPGFEPTIQDVGADDTATIQLAVAAESKTVVVTADATPVTESESGSEVSTLGATVLINEQPVTAADALRSVPGAIVNTAGQRGGLASLFVRGGESRYNKVIVDGVVVNDPGGTFDFGVVPMYQIDRVELTRGADSALYGSDAMTSVVQFWTRNGTTRTPEVRFGAEGGTFSTARGYASVAGARGAFDYNVFGEQFNTAGQGPNDEFSNSSQGANIGVALPGRSVLRFRTHHSNNRTGVQSFWNFNNQYILPPDLDQRARQNNFLASAEYTFAAPSRWQHRLTVYEYSHRRLNTDTLQEPGRTSPFGNFDFPFAASTDINRAAVDYQADYSPRAWARTVMGYHFEDENGFVGDTLAGVTSHGLRRNHEAFAEQLITWECLSLVGGGRFVHDESFGNRGVPRAAASFLLTRGFGFFGGTRLRASYSEGIKEPRFEETFGLGGFGIIGNPALKPEQNRAVDAGIEQSLWDGKYSVAATYYNNLFRDRIDFSFDPTTFIGQYVNVNRALAHGAEVELHGRPTARLRIDAGYVYTSTQILAAPFATDPLLSRGAPLLRRPKHSGNIIISYFGSNWGGDLTGTFVGRRSDSDFLGFVPPITYAPGYARFDAGAWHAVGRHVSAYVDVENFLNKRYQEVVGYPALKANFRAGLRFRFGGD